MEKKKKGHHLTTILICIAIFLAIVLAIFAPKLAMMTHAGGEIFLDLLKMIVVPLVMTSVLSGILGMGDVRKLGKPGAAAVGYYLMTTVLAVATGLVVVNIVQPGKGTVDEAKVAKIRAATENSAEKKLSDFLAESAGVSQDDIGKVFEELQQQEEKGIQQIIENMITMLFTNNLLKSALETDLLPLIVFCIIFGAMLTTLGPRVETFTNIIQQANTALLSFVMLLMKIAPIGIFCLVAARFGEAQAKGEFIQELTQIGWYFGTVLLGLGVHALVTLPLVFWIFRRENPYKFMMQMSQALLTAFSTASSSATLPITMECAEVNAGISKRSVEFVVPLGATINMDGTALYEAAAAIFISQVLGAQFDLSLTEQIIVAVTATLAAIGAAGIPEAGLFTMMIVLNAVGLPVEMVALILSVDWLLDRFRTTVNCFGDSVGAAVVEKTLPKSELDKKEAAQQLGSA